jgi:hypothetical protein
MRSDPDWASRYDPNYEPPKVNLARKTLSDPASDVADLHNSDVRMLKGRNIKRQAKGFFKDAMPPVDRYPYQAIGKEYREEAVSRDGSRGLSGCNKRCKAACRDPVLEETPVKLCLVRCSTMCRSGYALRKKEDLSNANPIQTGRR